MKRKARLVVVLGLVSLLVVAILSHFAGLTATTSAHRKPPGPDLSPVTYYGGPVMVGWIGIHSYG